MKTLRICLTALTAPLFLFSCSESVFDSLHDTESRVQITTLKAILPEAVQSRVSFIDDPENEKIQTVWSANEVLRAISSDGTMADYLINSEDAGKKTASFTGSGSFAVGDELTVVTATDVDCQENEEGEQILSFYLDNRNLNDEGEEIIMPSGLFLGKALVTGSETSGELILSPLSPLNAILKFELDLSEAAFESLTKADVIARADCLCQNGTYNLNQGTLEAVISYEDSSEEVSGEDLREMRDWVGVTFQEGNKLTLYLPIVPGISLTNLSIAVYPYVKTIDEESGEIVEGISTSFYEYFLANRETVPQPGKVYVIPMAQDFDEETQEGWLLGEDMDKIEELNASLKSGF